jgi:YYY domain-containing protein
LPEEYQYLLDEDVLGERNIFRAMGNNPPILKSYMLYGSTLWKECGLSPRDRELVILGVARALAADHAGGSAVEADTSRPANEEWDDLLPASVDNKPAYAAYYSEVSGGQRPVTWPAGEEKRRLMLQWIDEADVIALSSQRSLWSTPRLPLTHPLNVTYYRSLFNGDLGFELAAQFHAHLHVGPLTISDTGGELAWGRPPQIGWPPPGKLAAEEAFSVYDHPPVWIFHKTEDYTPQAARDVLQAVDLSNVVNMNPGEATQAPNGLLLQPWQWRAQQVRGTFAEVFNVDGLLSRRPAAGAVVWWLSTILLGWLAFPLAFSALPGLPDRGYALSRVLALLFVSWMAWLAAGSGLLPHTRQTLLLSVAVLALLSLVIVLRRRRALLDFLRDNLAYVGFVEILALVLFLLALGIRLGNPDVWDVIWGGEKPMDLAYFTAVLKSTSFPPYDPWYAGGYINYYYYGFVYVGALTKLLGIVPTVAYNLILPTLFSFTGLGAFAVAYNLVRHLDADSEQRLEIREQGLEISSGEQRLEMSDWRAMYQSPISNPQSRASYPGLVSNLQSLAGSLRTRAITAGLAAALLCVVLGNLGQVGVLVNAWQQAGDGGLNTGIGFLDSTIQTVDGALAVTVGGQDAPLHPGDWFWTATRAININEGEAAPITEFPFFTFLYGDLHAHMIALPLTLLALAWAVSLVLGAPPDDSSGKSHRLQTALVWLTGALAIGVLRATNTWDWPTYLLLGLLAVLYHAYVSNGRRLDWSMLGQAAFQGTALAVLSTLLFWPYVDNYGSGYESLRLWDGSYTHLTNYLVIYGLFLFLILTHLAREFRAWSRTWTTEDLAALQPVARPLLLGLFLYVILIGALFVLNYWIAPVVLTLAAFAGLLGLRPGLPAARRVLLILIAAGLALTLMVEVVVLEGDIGRMNTVFKFYMQVWVLFSVAGGAALALAWPTVRRRLGHTQRRLWQGLLLLLVGAAALYPLLATPARWNIRMSDEAPTTLDGMAFMQTTSYGDTAYDGSSRTIELDDEYEALRWMQRNVEGTPVVAEAHSGNPYRTIANRVAMYTGLPAIVGWDWHQCHQRAAAPDYLVWERVDDVRRLFETTNVGEALAIIAEYDVQYVYAGELERAYYPPVGLQKFTQMTEAGLLREVFSNEGVTIYEVTNTRQEISSREQRLEIGRLRRLGSLRATGPRRPQTAKANIVGPRFGDWHATTESPISNHRSPIANYQSPVP